MNLVSRLTMAASMLFLAGIAGSCPPASAASAMYRARYQCGGNDTNLVYFNMFADGTFTLQALPFELETPFPTVSFDGRYTEGPNTFDLRFRNVSRIKLEDLFQHTAEGGFVSGTDIYRIRKNPKRLYIHNCLIEKIPSG